MPLAIRIAALALLALTTAALAEPVTVSGIVFPDRIGEFARGPGRDYEKTDPGLGYSFVYRREPWTATVFVYDQRRTAIPDGPSSDVVKSEFEQAKRDVVDSVRAGAWRKADIIRDFTLPERGKPRFACATLSLVDQLNVVRDSTLCLTAAKGKFVKFRVTGSRGDDTAGVMQFIQGWIGVLWPGA